jgi:hypothetical protein
MSVQQLIFDTYYNPETGYSGAQKLYERLKNQGVTMKDVQEFLKTQHVVQVNKKNTGKLGSFVPQ